MDEIKNYYKNKIILVTGGAGSIGSHLVKELLKLNPQSIRVLDNNETGLFDLERNLNSNLIRPFVGDIRDKERLKRAVEGVEIVFHTAALKHVPLCEYNPFEAIKTNVIGTQNLIEASIDENVEKFITISTDKAVNPINVMGATKLLSERLTISSNYYKGEKNTALSCVRFGNVLDTRGSVIPIFRDQILNGNDITITDPEMTRFIMKISESTSLILKAARLAQGGEIFILKMPVVRISDLAEVMVKKLSCPDSSKSPEIKIIGKRIGEKLYEELMTIEESENAYEDKHMFIVKPPVLEIAEDTNYEMPNSFKKTEVKNYNSKNMPLLNKEEIKILINDSLCM
ncbi:MAG TPA: polysaccharide biosynthesis protein [Methanofastidiosum sp.]|jgi:FlaA1/EpsC-like NDP-sugar epimerase|nr:polysaccharide biosynthesis protein [Methanofastidiosum sp.]HOR87616.1 polysaccharide biosynthesis protein [Methanofastidiosum sp.]HPL01062.1 polysaccharide biosynthesis protein [Methanofastidiosum sp.]